MIDKKLKELHFRGSVSDLLTLSPLDSNMSEIEVLKVGKWNHPIYGEFEITAERLQRFKDNFDNKIRKVDPAIDLEHRSDEGAVGWFKELIFKGDVLTAIIEWTNEGASLIKGKKYRYFSPEFADEWQDPATNAVYRDVLIGGAITNRPFFQELEEITLSEQSKYMTFKDEMMECSECKQKIKKSEMEKHKREKHNLKGGELQMTKEELKKKLQENPDFTLAEAGVDAKLFEEVQEEIKKDTEAEAKKKEEEEANAKKAAEEEEAKKKAEEEAKKTSEMKTISTKEFSELKNLANQGVEALKKLREMELATQLKQFTVGESKDGLILGKDIDKVKAFAITLGENQRKAFFEILTLLPKGKIFGENGSSKTEEAGEEDSTAELDRRAKKIMSEDKTGKKTYSEAALEAESQMKAEGLETDKNSA